MKKAKEIFWSIIGFVFWTPWVLITFVILPIVAFANAKSIGEPGFFGAKVAIQSFAAEIYYKLLKTDVPEDEA